MKKVLLAVTLALPTLSSAGYFAHQSESYLIGVRGIGGNV